MANVSVLNGARAVPTVDVRADELLQKFKTANRLSVKLSDAVGVMTILNQHCDDDTAVNCTIHAVLSMLEEAFDMSNSLQWSYDVGGRAEHAMGRPG